MRTENLPAPAPPVKVRSAQDPEIREEVKRLLGLLHTPDFVATFAQEMVALRAENAALKKEVSGWTAAAVEVLRGPRPVHSFDANGSEVAP